MTKINLTLHFFSSILLELPKGGGIAEFAPWLPADVGCWWSGPPYNVPNGFPAVELINLSPQTGPDFYGSQMYVCYKCRSFDFYLFFVEHYWNIWYYGVYQAKKLFVSKKVSLLNNHCLFIILLTLHIECRRALWFSWLAFWFY